MDREAGVSPVMLYIWDGGRKGAACRSPQFYIILLRSGLTDGWIALLVNGKNARCARRGGM
jgi:hypothetical protein